jgi:hypothetical protein
MIAYIGPTQDGKTRIEFVDELGIHQDTVEVDAIHIETQQENTEIINRAFKGRTLAGGCFHAN